MNDHIIIATVSTGSTLLGIIVGAVLNYYLEKDRRKEELFFEARKSAYGTFVGIVRNIILEGFSENDIREFNSVASECLLISRDPLRSKVIEFCNSKAKIRNDSSEGRFDIPAQNELLRGLKEIEILMKLELGIKN